MVYDLRSKGQLTWEFTWDQTNELDSAAIPDGIRRVHATTAGTLEIIDRNFASNEQRVVSVLHGIAAKNFLRLQLINQGKQLLVLHRWPLWPWRLLATQGQMPLDALFLCSHTTQELFTTGDGILFSAWDVETSKKISQVLVSPPVSQNVTITEDGKKIVIPEALKSADSCFWVKLTDPAKSTGVTKPVVQYLPTLPRGVRVVDLGAKQTTILEHALTDTIQRTNVGGFCVSLAQNQLMVSYLSVVPNFYTGVPVYVVVSQQLNDETFPRYDLSTRTKMSNGLPNCTLLAPPGWGAQMTQCEMPWPPGIQDLGKRLGYDLNAVYPRPHRLTISFIDLDRQENYFQYQLSSSAAEMLQTAYSADKQAIVVWKQLSNGVQVIRWQVPFEVYSPWWSLGAGLFFFTLPLVWWVWRHTSSPRIAS